MELEGKVALVTGAGSGIGKAAALKMAAQGAKVGVLSRTLEEVQEAADEIMKAGGEAIPLVADVSDESAMRAAVDKLISTYGRLDIVFANAGINGMWAPIDDLTPEEWDKTVSVNLRGTYLTFHLTTPHLKKAGGGSVIVTASINGTRTFSNTGATAYSATKAAQVAMTKMLALELAEHRIRVNVICPGKIATSIDDSTQRRNVPEEKTTEEFPEGMIPLTHGKAGTSEECADLVLFLASDRSRHITGTPIWIDGGQSLLV
jgi:NAD(P)-dependent dehydrogenase (short-subunit alcohol dehydrogenase family)